MRGVISVEGEYTLYSFFFLMGAMLVFLGIHHFITRKGLQVRGILVFLIIL